MTIHFLYACMFYHSSAGYLCSKCMTGLIEGKDSISLTSPRRGGREG